jgi:hypothetical protein
MTHGERIDQFVMGRRTSAMPPKADKSPHRSEMMRRAMPGLLQRSE